jgi:hypothetical protein
MSEKLYVLLLRLYPSHFREAYGDEALQLLRDRVREERGLAPRLRLWWDLMADLAISLPREYRHLRPVLAGTTSARYADGAPHFYTLEGGLPRPEALCSGAALSMVMLAALTILMSSARDKGMMDHSVLRDLTPTMMASSDGGDKSHTGSGNGASDAPGKGGATGDHSAEHGAVMAAVPVGSGGTTVDSAEHQRVIDRAAANLKQYYFDHDVAQKTADALLAHEKDGDDDKATQGAAFTPLTQKVIWGTSAT